jgi:hypothetical protein
VEEEIPLLEEHSGQNSVATMDPSTDFAAATMDEDPGTNEADDEADEQAHPAPSSCRLTEDHLVLIFEMCKDLAEQQHARAPSASVWTSCMTPYQASLRRVDARLVASLSSSDFAKMNARVHPMSSALTGFFSSLIAKFLQFLHTTDSGSGSIGGRGTQSTACSGFHACGRTGGKSPCLYVDNCLFFFKV